MNSTSLHSVEKDRLSSLYQYKILDTQQEASFNDLCSLASQICQTSAAMITFVDHSRQWIKAKIGINLIETPRNIAFCDYTIRQTELFQVTDATVDERFYHNPLVNNEPYIRFYAGFPLCTPSGHRIGALCVVDTSPKQLTHEQGVALRGLSEQVMQLMEFRYLMAKLHQEYFDNIEQQQILLENRLTLRAILDSTNDGHILIDANFKILSFNKVMQQAFERFFKQSIAIGEDFWQYIAGIPSIEDEFKSNFNTTLLGNKVSVEKNVEIKAGLFLWYAFQFSPAYDEYGSIMGVTLNASNIDKQKRLQLRILSQNQRLQDIANFQSHKIRRPVATMLGLIQILDKTSLSRENKELISMLENTAQELDEVIHQIVHKTNMT
jgi:PAS domain S-box-containing protein